MKTRFPACKILLLSGTPSSLSLLDSARVEGHNFYLLLKPVPVPEILAEISKRVGSADKDRLADHTKAALVRLFASPVCRRKTLVVALAALGNAADEKLTSFTLRLGLTNHLGILRDTDPDLFSEAEALFAPSKAKPKKARKTTAIPTFVKPAEKKVTAKKQKAALIHPLWPRIVRAVLPPDLPTNRGGRTPFRLLPAFIPLGSPPGRSRGKESSSSSLQSFP